MKHFLVIGDPVDHSLSPALHRQIFGQLGIKATYDKKRVGADELPDIMAEMLSGKLTGVNVTIPYKETVLSLLDILSPEAEAIGAVNCIAVAEGKLVGHNTDYRACQYLFHEHGLVRPNRHFVILGAGGSARSVAYALIQYGIHHFTLVNRDPERARDLADHFRKKYQEARIIVSDLESIDSAQNIVWINCTPVGMGALSKQSPIPGDKISSRHVVMDLIYRPLRTPLLKLADDHNAGIVSGLDFLIEQGLASERIWFGSHVISNIDRYKIIMDLIFR